MVIPRPFGALFSPFTMTTSALYCSRSLGAHFAKEHNQDDPQGRQSLQQIPIFFARHANLNYYI